MMRLGIEFMCEELVCDVNGDYISELLLPSLYLLLIINITHF